MKSLHNTPAIGKTARSIYQLAKAFNPLASNRHRLVAHSTFEYTEISELVELVDQRLEEIGDNRRFFRLDGDEYEGVYYLLPMETKERLAQKGVLEFFYD